MTIKLSFMNKTNDMNENSPINFGVTVKDDELTPNLEEMVAFTEELNNRLRSSSLISCFSQNTPSEHINRNDSLFEMNYMGCGHHRMWAQYAAGHTGVCIFFDKEKLVAQVTEYAAKHGFELLHGPVNYGEVSPDATTAQYDDFLKMGGEAYAEAHRNEHAQHLYFNKDYDWVNEQEYRFVIVDGGGVPEMFVPIDGCVSAICLGAKFPSEYDVCIKEAKEKLGCDVFKAYYMNRLVIFPYLKEIEINQPPDATAIFDHEFGDDGKIELTYGGRSDAVSVTNAEDTGDLVVLCSMNSRRRNGTLRDEEYFVVKYTKAGVIDRSFGDDGSVDLTVESGGRIKFQSVHSLSDGGFLVAGTCFDECNKILFVKLTGSGVYDLSYGQDGVAWATANDGVQLIDAVTANNGMIYASCSTKVKNNHSASSHLMAVVCLNEFGIINEGFGDNGFCVTPTYAPATRSTGMLVSPNGNVYVPSPLNPGNNAPYALISISPHGCINNAVWQSGILILRAPDGFVGAEVCDIKEQAGKGIVIAGFAYKEGHQNHTWFVCRYRYDGELDEGFAHGGFAVEHLSNESHYSRASQVHTNQDGAILVGGNFQGGYGLIAYNPDGAHNEIINGGKAVTSHNHVQDFGDKFLVQSDGGVIVLGTREIDMMAQISIHKYLL